MEVTKKQIASDVVRNLSEALARLCEANVHTIAGQGLEVVEAIQNKLQEWIDKL